MGKIVDGVYLDSNGKPAHRGAVRVDGKIYYAGKNGELVKAQRKVIHHGMANGLLMHGSYYFDTDGAADLGSFKKTKQKRKKREKNSQKAPKALRRRRRIFITACSALILIEAALIVGFELRGTDEPLSTDQVTAAQSEGVEITVPKFDEDVYLCSNAMKEYYEEKYTLQEIVESGAKAYAPLVFKYTVKNAASAELIISENSDYSNALHVALDTGAASVSLDNLKTGTQYYYIISALDGSGQEYSRGGSFKTAKTNRFVYLPGVYNTRDIGGYRTADGRMVRQGLLIRGTEIDGLVENGYFLTDPEAAAPFGFVCDCDLRNGNIFNASYVSRLGEGVSHRFHNSPMYGGIFAEGNEEYLRYIFSTLADENNYPMYLHCTYGADRTGTIVLLLQGLLGVSEEDMRTEYELTGFFIKDFVYGSGIEPVINGLQGTEGDTLEEKIENYLRDTIGVTDEEIDAVRKIFLTDENS